MEARIQARIAALEAERDTFIVTANKTIYAYGVTINELKKLLAPDAPVPAGSGSGGDGEEQADGASGDGEA